MGKWPDTNPTIDEDGWTNQYSTYTKQLGSFHLSITYSTQQKTNPGYLMSINGMQLKATRPDYQSARDYIVRLALKRAEESVVKLKEEVEKLNRSDQVE